MKDIKLLFDESQQDLLWYFNKFSNNLFNSAFRNKLIAFDSKNYISDDDFYIDFNDMSYNNKFHFIKEPLTQLEDNGTFLDSLHLPLPFVPYPDKNVTEEYKAYNNIINRNIYNSLQGNYDIQIGCLVNIDSGIVCSEFLAMNDIPNINGRIIFKPIKNVAHLHRTIKYYDFIFIFGKLSVEQELLILHAMGHGIIPINLSTLKSYKYISGMGAQFTLKDAYQFISDCTTKRSICDSVRDYYINLAKTHIWDDRVKNRLINCIP